MNVMLEVAPSLLLFLPFLFANPTTGSNVTTGNTYESVAGIARKGKPIRSLQVIDSFYCTIECNVLNRCKSFNVMLKENGFKGILCEFFADSLVSHQDKAQFESMKHSTYYQAYTVANDCICILKKSGNKASGIYQLHLDYNKMVTDAFCDMDTTDGGWTLLQRRFDGSVDFYRDWDSYRNGFGGLNGEFWLGLEKAHQLMKNTNTTLRFDLWDGEDHYFQEYYEAGIANEFDGYRLTYNGTAGSAGDSLTRKSKDQMFSTNDRDNDERTINCAETYHGAWWYSDCHHVNLNGKYGDQRHAVGLNWKAITGHTSSLSKTEIKVKRIFPIGC